MICTRVECKEFLKEKERAIPGDTCKGCGSLLRLAHDVNAESEARANARATKMYDRYGVIE